MILWEPFIKHFLGLKEYNKNLLIEREIAQCLRALNAHPQVPYLIISEKRNPFLTTIFNSRPRGSRTLLWPQWALIIDDTHRNACRQNIHTYKNKLIISK